MQVSLQTKSFLDLSVQELYDVLALRSEVFVVEQNCVYQDIDQKDQKALHVLMTHNGALVGYARLFAPLAYFKNASIGRVIIKSTYRHHQLGKQLMQYAIQAIKTNYQTDLIEISAQCYLIKFYEDLGFLTVGDSYLEDDIPHIKMVKTN